MTCAIPNDPAGRHRPNAETGVQEVPPGSHRHSGGIQPASGLAVCACPAGWLVSCRVRGQERRRLAQRVLSLNAGPRSGAQQGVVPAADAGDRGDDIGKVAGKSPQRRRAGSRSAPPSAWSWRLPPAPCGRLPTAPHGPGTCGPRPRNPRRWACPSRPRRSRQQRPDRPGVTGSYPRTLPGPLGFAQELICARLLLGQPDDRTGAAGGPQPPPVLRLGAASEPAAGLPASALLRAFALPWHPAWPGAAGTAT
jgi:hypothetical protein